MSTPKCSECPHGRKANFPRNGNGASWRSGHFYQEGVACLYDKPGGIGIILDVLEVQDGRPWDATA